MNERSQYGSPGSDPYRILHDNATKHSTSGWIIQQLGEVFPFEASHKYPIFDQDQKLGSRRSQR